MVKTVIVGAGADNMAYFLRSIGIKVYGTDEHELDGKLAEAIELDGGLAILMKMKVLELDDGGDKSWQPALLKAVYDYLQMERCVEPLDIFVEVDRNPSALAEAEAIEDRAAELFALLILNPDDQEACITDMLQRERLNGDFDRCLIVQRVLQVYAPHSKALSLTNFFRHC